MAATKTVMKCMKVVDMPDVDDEIEVRYEHEGDLVWWPGVMESSWRNGTRTKYLGRGEIMYEARGNHGREKEHLRFLPGRQVQLSGAEGTITTWRMKPEVERDEDEESYEAGGSRRPSKRSKSDHTSTKTTRTSTTGGRNAEEGDGQVEMRDIAVKSLATRVTKVERLVHAKTTCNHAAIINHCVNVKRTVFRRAIVKQLQITPRTWKRTGTPFQECIRTDVEQISVMEDLQLFQFIVDDVRARSHETGRNRIIVRPHWVDVKRTIRCTSADVLFSTVNGLMEWLDVTSAEKIDELCVKQWKDKGVTNMRVVGTLRWDETNETAPLQLFTYRTIGPRSRKAPIATGMGTEASSEETAEAVEWTSSTWDLENNCLLSRPAAVEGDVGTIEDARNSDCFSIRWKADGVTTGRREGCVVDPTDVVTGTISVNVPVVYFRGNQLCDDIRKEIDRGVVKILKK